MQIRPTNKTHRHDIKKENPESPVFIGLPRFKELVRVTGLEPVRRKTHAPQTCLSAYSSTLANI